MESTHLVMEFITHTGANKHDAVSCLKSWEWDLKKALIDYNDTSTTEYFNNKKNENEVSMKAKPSPICTLSSHLHGPDVPIVSPTLMHLTSIGQKHPSPGITSSVTLSNNQHHLQLQSRDSVDKNCVFGGSNSSSNSSTSSTTLHVPKPSAQKLSPPGLEATVNAHPYHQYHLSTNTIASAPTVGIGHPERCRSGLNFTSSIPNVQLKPTLAKSDSVDIFDCKKLERGISRATENVTLVSRARQEFEMDFHAHIHEQNDKNLNFIDTPDYTFTLPDLTKYTDDFRNFLEKDLIESSTMNSLEATNRLNWWYESGTCRKLWPLATTGDGNCLLHAASLSMWGFHDRRLTLRRTLHDILSKEDFRETLYRRWRFQQTRVNKQAGFVFCESEWAKEWEEIVAIASPEPRRNSKSTGSSRRRSLLIEKSFDGVACGSTSNAVGDETATYESLEEIHVLALAHILRRTIIVVSDVFLRDINGEAFSPIPFGGVYLPFEVPSNECHRAPLLLAYDMAHFSALVAMEGPNDTPPAFIPLVDATNQLLPIQFCIDPGNDFNWQAYDGSDGNWTLTDREHIALLKEYLDIVHATGSESPDDEIYYDDCSDDEYEKKIGDGETVLTADENCNNNSIGVGSGGFNATVTITPTGTSTTSTPAIPGASLSSGGTVASMTASNQSLLGGGGSKDVGSKSKAAKQLQSVAKQFGSIGKSMSRKLRKNIGSITRIGSKHSGSGGNAGGNSKKSQAQDKNNFRGEYPRFRILCAQLKSRRHEYQEEMIKNYLECAQERYLETERVRDRKEMERLRKSVAEVGQQRYHNHDYHEDVGCDRGLTEHPEADGREMVNCINAGCMNFGTVATSYMCLECYEMQCKRESNCNSSSGQSTALLSDNTLRYGTGKSKFYTEADMAAHDRIQRLPSARRLNDLDQTLYLSRSTFYNDTKPENVHTGPLIKQIPLYSSLEQTSATGILASGVNSHAQQHNHHHQHHGEGGAAGRGDKTTTYPEQSNHERSSVLITQYHSPPASEYSNSAKPQFGASPGSSCGCTGATMYPPSCTGSGVEPSNCSGNTGNATINVPYNRATALCVVNLPPISGGSSNKGQPICKPQSYGALSSGAPEAPRAVHQAFSSSSSSSSLGGSNGPQQSSAIANSSHYGKNQLCRTEGCTFYGSINTNFYCSKCCQEFNI